jgi:hypothetical protein
MVDTVAITKAQYSISRSQLTVLATDTNTDAVLTVSVTSTGEILGRWTPGATAITAANLTGLPTRRTSL